MKKSLQKILIILMSVCFIAIGFKTDTCTVQAEGESTFPPEQKPEVLSNYIYLINLDTHEVLWDKNGEERMYPASMTKMMTLIVAIENLSDTNEMLDIDETVMAGLKEANASIAGFDLGDQVPVIDLMYGVLLPSGAECSRALALRVAGSLDNYVDMMNAKAQEIGMYDTHFVNTTGLHDDNHYSTAKDMATLLEYCLQNPTFYKILNTPEYISYYSVNDLPDGLPMYSTVWKYLNHPENEINFSLDGFIGGKSGFTLEANYCLASVAEHNGTTYLLVDADSFVKRYYPSNVEDAVNIYNYYFDNYAYQTLFTQDEVLQTIPTKYNLSTREIEVLAPQTYEATLPVGNNLHVEYDLPTVIEAPISKGEVIGHVNVYAFDQLVYSTDLYAAKDIGRNPFVYVGWIIVEYLLNNILVTILLAIVLIVLIIIVLRKRKKNKKRVKRRVTA